MEKIDLGHLYNLGKQPPLSVNRGTGSAAPEHTEEEASTYPASVFVQFVTIISFNPNTTPKGRYHMPMLQNS